MSRQTAYTYTEVLIPNSFTTAGTYTFTITGAQSAYTDSNSTTCARLQLASNRNSARQSQGYYEFNKDSLDNIPQEATIDSVVCKVKYNISSTNYVTALSMRLYNGSTAMGTEITNRPTSATQYSISGGTWTLAQLQNIRLYVSCTHNTSTSTAYLYFYGADITITYTISGTEYQVTINNTSTATTEPTGTTYVFQGKDKEIKINTTDISDLEMTDNGTSVTMEPAYEPIVTATTLNPTSFEASYTSYTYSGANGYHSTANTSTYARLRGSNNNVYTTTYHFTVNLPDNATINSVSCALRGMSENGTSGTYVGYARLRCNSTVRGSEVTINNTTSTVYNITDTGEWSIEDLEEVNLQLEHPHGSNRYIRFYGADLTVDYSIPGTGGTILYYTYTISNISADHTISLSEAVSQTLFQKINGNWNSTTKAYKKINILWVEQTDLTNLFENGSIYINKGS